MLATRAVNAVSTKAIARRPVVARRAAVVVKAEATPKFSSDWIKKDPLVLVLGFAGWTIPANIAVSGFGGKSLFGLLTESIGQELAHFPTGPALDSKFWLYLAVYHVGLFTTIILGQIGVQGRKQGYW